MKDKTMFDTNILVYAFDIESGKKHEICKSLVEKVFYGQSDGIVSNQILGELFYTLTKKSGHNLSAEDAYKIVEKLIDSDKWVKLNYSAETVKRAMSNFKNTGMHFWDAIIAETMKENGITTIITENTEDFKNSGVKTINPLK